VAAAATSNPTVSAPNLIFTAEVPGSRLSYSHPKANRHRISLLAVATRRNGAMEIAAQIVDGFAVSFTTLHHVG